MNTVNESLSTPQAEKSCIAQLKKEQFEKLQNFIRKRVMNREDAEDILQQTFAEALYAESSFRHHCKLETWLCGIALNLIRNHFRKLYRRPLHIEFQEELAHTDPGRDIFAYVECSQDLSRTVEAIAVLPTAMRHTLEVTMQTDGSYQDAADALGVPIGTVRSRLSRARIQLRDYLPEGFRM